MAYNPTKQAIRDAVDMLYEFCKSNDLKLDGLMVFYFEDAAEIVKLTHPAEEDKY